MANGRNDFVITTNGDIWSLRLSRRRVLWDVRLCAIAGLFILVVSCWMALPSKASAMLSGWGEWHPFTMIGLAIAILLWSIGCWIWRLRDTPLTINVSSGEVLFGGKQLCEPGSVQAVQLKRDSDPENIAPYSFRFRLPNNHFVKVPHPTLDSLRDATIAKALVEQMAAQLKVRVESDV